MKNFLVRVKILHLETFKGASHHFTCVGARFVNMSRHLRILGSRLKTKPTLLNLKIPTALQREWFNYSSVRHVASYMLEVQRQISVAGLATLSSVNKNFQETKNLNRNPFVLILTRINIVVKRTG